MGWLESLALAVVQGLTEFLPVSSSGHLVLAQSLLGAYPADAVRFYVVLHLGTALAALLFYRRDVAGVLRALVPPYARNGGGAVQRRLLLLLAAATLPTAVIGLAFQDAVERMFASPAAVTANLAVTGFALLAVSTLREGDTALERVSWWKAALVGVAQGIAVAPGISRSGSTIAAGLALGLRREDAVRFSFLLSLPAIAGAALLELRGGAGGGAFEPARYGLGFAVAAATGYLAILLVLRWTRAGRIWVFGAYCLAVAAVSGAVLALR